MNSYGATANQRSKPSIGKRLAATGLALGIALPTSSIIAAEWTVAPEVEVSGHYNDNARLSEGDEGNIVISGARLDVGALAQRRTERSTVLVRPRLHFSEYPGDDDESTDAQYLDFRASTEGLRSNWDIKGNFAQEQIIRGEDVRLEFPDEEIGEPEVGETGRLQRTRDRTLWRIRPSFSYELTQRTEAGIAVNYIDVNYDNELPGEATDFTDTTAEFFVVREMAEDSRFRATLFVSEYEVDEISNKSTSYGLKTGYEREVSETFNVFFHLGIQQTDVEAGQLDESDTSFLADAGFLRTWERTRLRAQLGRSIQPTGSGFLRQTDKVRVNLHHQFRPRWYGELAGVGQVTESLENEVDVNDRDYYKLEGVLGYEMTRSWEVELAYVRTFQDYDDTPGDADANELFLKLRYQPRGAVWSR